MVCEHTRLEGMSVKSFNRTVTDAVCAYQRAKKAIRASLDFNSIANNPLVSRFSFSLPGRITKHRKNLSSPFNHNLKQEYELVHSTIASLGSSYLQTHQLPAKASYQIILQLAFRLYYGHNPPSWEAIPVAHFRGGRIDWLQAVITPPISRFCTAPLNPSLPIPERQSLFHEAVHSHANLALQIRQGHGFTAHLHGRHAALREGEEEHEFCKSQDWLDTRAQASKRIMMDCCEEGTVMLEMGCYLKGEDDGFVHYEVEEGGGEVFCADVAGEDGEVCWGVLRRRRGW